MVAHASCACPTRAQTAEEAIEHGTEKCSIVGNGKGGRVYDAQGRTPCLWDGCARGCANPIAASCNVNGVLVLGGNVTHVRSHEKEHTKGAPPKG